MSLALRTDDRFITPDASFAAFTAPQILANMKLEGNSTQGSSMKLPVFKEAEKSTHLENTETLSEIALTTWMEKSTRPKNAGTAPAGNITTWTDFLSDLSKAPFPYKVSGADDNVYDQLYLNETPREIAEHYFDIENHLLKSICSLIAPSAQVVASDEKRKTPLVLPIQWLKLIRRIRYLKTEAIKSDERFSASSENALKEAMKVLPYSKPPSVFLLENGNLRTVWRCSDKQQIALQFRGNDDIQFVFFFKREDSDEIKFAYGRDSVAGIIKQIEGFNLSHLLF